MASKPVGSEQLAARVQLAVNGEVVSSGLVKAKWSDDESLTTRINPEVAHYTGQTELAAAIQEGLAAKASGDEATATVKLGRAVQLAQQTGNEEATSRLRKVVEIDDEEHGTVRLKRNTSTLDEMALDTARRRRRGCVGERRRLPQRAPSESTDYCDVCGEPIAAASAPAVPPAGASSPAPGASSGTPAQARVPELRLARPGRRPVLRELRLRLHHRCPARPGGARVGALARPAVASHAGDPGRTRRRTGRTRRTGGRRRVGRDAAAAPGRVARVRGHPAAGRLRTARGSGVDPGHTGTAAGEQPGGEPADPASAAPSGAHLPTPPVPGPDQWVVEIWIDPDWYAAQQPEDPMPSAGLPGLVVLRERSVLVGRPSVSRGIHPQVDCGADTGVSRRHCQLSTDGQRWWVEDLQSSNGTYVSPAGEPLPTDPIPAGQRRELADGDRVYLGAWTRLVVRKALPGEA